MSGMDDLITWLRAQLDADERVALDVPESRRSWHTAGGWPETGPDSVSDGIGLVVEEADELDVLHIARWDPARVLAEVDAKRRTLDYIEVEVGKDHARTHVAIQTARLLALPYADQPGYLDEWRL